MVTVPYTTEQARIDVAALRGQIDLIAEALTQADGGVVPNQPAALQATQFVSNSYQKYVSGADGNAYSTGGLHLVATTTTAINATSGQNIAGLGAPVAAIRYRILGHIVLITGSGTAQQLAIGFTGPTVSNFQLGTYSAGTSVSSNVQLDAVFTTIGSRASLAQVYGASSTVIVKLDGTVNFSAAGTFQVQMSYVTTAGSATVQIGSVADLIPVT